MNSPAPQSLPDFYRVLGADPLAKLEQIEDLFRQLATEAERTSDHTKIPEAVEAFKVLRDPNLRQQYDQRYFEVYPVQSRPENVAASSPDPLPQENSTTVDASSNVASPEIDPPSVSNANGNADQPQPAVDDSEEAYQATLANKSSVDEELSLKPEVLAVHRRELLRMFYEKRRKNMRASGMAIGGLDTVVSYSYELLEFHLWVLSEKKWIVREESGALSISALGCENHEKNLIDGVIEPSI